MGYFDLLRPEEEKVIETYLDGQLEAVQIPGGIPFCRLNKNRDFREYSKEASLISATRAYLAGLKESMMQIHQQGDGRIRHERTRAQGAEMVEKILAEIEDEVMSRFVAALDQGGVFRQGLISPSTAEVEDQNSEAFEDLNRRLLTAAGDRFGLLVISRLFPETIKKAMESLPPGQDADDIAREENEVRQRSGTMLKRQIAEAEKFLEKMLKKFSEKQ